MIKVTILAVVGLGVGAILGIQWVAAHILQLTGIGS